MGGDGGSIPTRIELVKVKQAPEKVSQEAKLVAKWQYCALSDAVLAPPIMACELGRFYNKEAVLNYLLTKDSASAEQKGLIGHVRSLKDLREVRFTPNDQWDGKADSARFACPVTGLTMNGKHSFVFFWGCGCAVSDRAVREVKSDACHKCGKPFSAMDIVTLCPNAEETAKLQEMMKERRRQQKQAKDKVKADEAAAAAADSVPSAAEGKAKAAQPKRQVDDSASASSAKVMKINPAVAISKSELTDDEKKRSAVYKSLFMDKAKQDATKRGLAGFGQTFF